MNLIQLFETIIVFQNSGKIIYGLLLINEDYATSYSIIYNLFIL